MDSFGLPGEGFLTHDGSVALQNTQETLLHPLNNGEMLNAISLPVDVLAFLTRELVLPVENGALDNVDIIDIPVFEDRHADPLRQAKSQWLLEHYRQQLQPDVLVICNATAQHEQTAKKAKVLMNWVRETQPAEESALPGLVWVITPHDARFTTRQNLDEAVQHLLGKPGLRWGTLQALDSHSSAQGARYGLWPATACSASLSGCLRPRCPRSDRSVSARSKTRCVWSSRR